MSYLDQLKQTTNEAITENGAVSNASTLDPVLDFFARASAMRGDIEGAVKLFQRAYIADPRMAMKALFYMRDVRGGQGERMLFRACLFSIQNEEENLAKVAPFVAEFGRWDDIFWLPKTIGIDLIAKQLEQDEANMAKGESVSLLAKWLPSENASSARAKMTALEVAASLGLKPREYRKKTVALRTYIKLLEQKMSANEWKELDYETLPSQAHRKHVKAFRRHDEAGYEEYLGAVEKGEKKIKTSTLYTYEVFDMVGQDERAANAMWDNLPDYTSGSNALVMADVSGSMMGRPMSVSVSLALYFAERNTGAFAGTYMTFTDRPSLVQVKGTTLADKLSFIESHDVGYNTDLAKAFDAILNAAVNGKVEQDELPSVLYIISDMEFDNQMSNCGETNFQTAKRKFEEAGYKLPHVVFWNVDSRNDQVPATMYDNAVTLISGLSQSTFKYAVEGKSPIEFMTEVLNSERYAPIDI